MVPVRLVAWLCISLAMTCGVQADGTARKSHAPSSSVVKSDSPPWLSMDGTGYADAVPDRATARLSIRGKSDPDQVAAEANLRARKGRVFDLVRGVLGEEPDYGAWELKLGFDSSPEHGWFAGDPSVASMISTFPIRDVARASAIVWAIRKGFDEQPYDGMRIGISADVGISRNAPEAIEAHGKALADAIGKARAKAERNGLVLVGEPLAGEPVDSVTTTAGGGVVKSTVNILWKVAPPQAK